MDVLTGNVYDLDADHWSKQGNLDRFSGIPVYDSPVLLAERSLIPLMEI